MWLWLEYLQIKNETSNLLHNGTHIFHSYHQPLSRSVPVDLSDHISAKCDFLLSVLYYYLSSYIYQSNIYLVNGQYVYVSNDIFIDLTSVAKTTFPKANYMNRV